MVYTTQSVRDNIRNRDGKSVFFLGEGDRLTQEARDYLKSRDIPILPAAEAKIDAYRGLDGAQYTRKPESMTGLRGDVLVRKTHPVIAFRGAVDTLESEILLCQHFCPRWREPLSELLALARRLIRCDVMEEPVGDVVLGGLTEQMQRQRSHFPQKFYGIPHFMPEYTDGEVLLHLNHLRCITRQAELAAAEAFTDKNGVCTREDIVKALNRMSSTVYIWMLQQKAGSENGA